MNSVAMDPTPIPDEKSSMMAASWGPSWGSYLYQNFLVAGAAVPTPTLDWLNASSQPQQTSLTGVNNVSMNMNNVNSSAVDYFGLPATTINVNTSGTEWADTSAPAIKTEVDDSSFYNQQQQQQQQRQMQQQQRQQQQQQQQQQAQAGPSSFYPQFYFPQTGGINTSLLTQTQTQNQVQDYSPHSTIDSVFPSLSSTSHRTSTDSVHIVDSSLTRSPSPISSLVVSPHESPALRSVKIKIKGRPRRGGKKRSHSILSDSDASHTHDEHDHDHDHENEHEPEVPEGVERDGMIWGMKVEDYRALSARERKRVRNRISARTFRAKRKEHLTSLEHDLGAKDLQIKIANDEANRLRKEVADLKRKLAKYEKQY